MPAEIIFTLSEQDYADAARSQYWQRLRSPRQWAWPLAALAGIFGFLAYLDSCCLESFAYNLIPYLLIALIIGPLLAGLTYLWVGRHARRLFRQQPSKPENRVSWNEEGLKIESELGFLKAKWSDFHCWRTAGRTHMIHMNDALYYLIPGHALSSEQADDLQGTLSRHGVSRR
jgi:hypothetical protein